ncbi:MAG: enoyl-CoA hydratase [Desulfobacula sp.]|jgi:enoyl-CoA hydratase/carnithine racemase|uniref:enoyl-CoA hydratase/isomerase family protein n=1 Tax=Desulfobacula sp. TaxID=2593537 RepID=UPI001D3930E5|nr:enoyl-CoA hydratase [Desulfobacula sp.]MBT3486579.1 enoyl-CoA hydratase [Desulfobacula sp.]MBT3805762.1 enoyl-CoA hydratase [Desulfobacula sp.]MBT4023945.1 enoyl-CoA hydratase [Desulfobacula sp.]MBT4200351.1 enoyl-CoA hydratase [Desulfobacula sp.]
MLVVEKKDFIAFLTIDYPEKRNALTPELLLDLHNTLEGFSKNDDVRCVVIKGSGNKVFSSGFDISAIPVAPLSGARQKAPETLLQAFDTIKNFAYPTIAMLNGHAFGAGFNLCACCDIRIAADDIKLGMTPARLGVAYHPKGIQQFIEAFGIARTKEIFFTAGIFQSKALVQKGIVNHMVPRQELEMFTHAYAKKITQNAPLSLKGIKKIITMFENDMALNQKNLDQADQLMQKCFQSDDLKEGQKAFLEKRSPEFTGK